MTFVDEAIERRSFEVQKILGERLGWRDIVVFDVGGHHGESVDDYRRLFPECVVHSFEPHPESFGKLQQKYMGMGGVYCHQAALGKAPGTASLYGLRTTAASSLLAPEPFLVQGSPDHKWDYFTVEVAVDTVDMVAERLQVDSIHILKVDVQGLELEVMQGARSCLASRRIKMIMTEATFAETYEGQTDFSELCLHLKAFGYVMWDLLPFIHTTSGRLWTANALFLSGDVVPLVTLPSVRKSGQPT
jgi:FkbM family methyltransferase